MSLKKGALRKRVTNRLFPKVEDPRLTLELTACDLQVP